MYLMDLEEWYLMMEVTIKGCLRIIWCMVKVHITIMMDQLRENVIGNKEYKSNFEISSINIVWKNYY